MKSRLGKVKDELFGAAGLAATIVSLLGFTGNQIFDYWKSANNAHQQRLVQEADAFLQTTKEFDAIATSFAFSVMDDKYSVESRDKLVSNIMQQNGQIDLLLSILKLNAMDVQNYKIQLSDISMKAQADPSIMEMGEYWSQLSDAMETRTRLVDSIRRALELPS